MTDQPIRECYSSRRKEEDRAPTAKKTAGATFISYETWPSLSSNSSPGSGPLILGPGVCCRNGEAMTPIQTAREIASRRDRDRKLGEPQMVDEIAAALRNDALEKAGEAALDDIYCDNCNSAIACASCARIHGRVIQAIRALKREA